MFFRRLACLFGFHNWGGWSEVRDVRDGRRIFRQRQCVVCAKKDIAC